jgi:hypothetical protein
MKRDGDRLRAFKRRPDQSVTWPDRPPAGPYAFVPDD